MSTMKREALHMEGPTLGYAAMTHLAGKIGVVTPFVVWPVAVIFAVVLHQFWPDNMWVLAFVSSLSVAFAYFGWYLTHDRKGLASEHMIFTFLAYGTLFCLVDHMGWTRLTTFLMIFGVFALCLSWSMRNVVRHHDNAASGSLDELFTTAGLDGAKMHVKPLPGEQRKRRSLPWTKSAVVPVITDAPKDGKQRSVSTTSKREGKVLLKPGQTVDELQRKLGSIESAGKLPPGTISVSKNPDRADVADVALSNPRVLNESQPWPGPSYVNGSVEDTISVGRYQDGTEVEFNMVGLQMQVMGMTGSGKSLGAGWSTIAELITRRDVIVWGVDITKGEQTLGPLRPALHRLATTPEEAKELLDDVNRLIKPRTNYLTKKGLQKWRKDCGLKYMVVELEEVPEIIEALQEHERGERSGDDIWVNSVKAARSAGISFIWSLQRADAEQIPIVARSQSVKWCFGVAEALDASFGLSKPQDNAGCEPENWQNRYPGKFFLDAPSIPEAQIIVPGRAWYWGTDDKLIRAHAEAYPASDREYDEVMLAVLGNKSSMSVKADTSTHLGTQPVQDNNESEDEVISDEELDQELAELTNDFELAKTEPMPPAAARSIIRNWLTARSGQTVTNADLVEVRNSTGYGIAWGYKVMHEFETSGLVSKADTDNGLVWIVTDQPGGE